MIKKIYVVWIFALCLVITSVYGINPVIIGNCNSSCIINSLPYYTINLTEGVISNWTDNSSFTWGNDKHTSDGIGMVYFSGAFQISKSVTTTNCSVSTNTTTVIKINCVNANVTSNWTFNNNYVEQNVTVNHTYRIYSYTLHHNQTTNVTGIYNTSNNFSGTSATFAYTTAARSYNGALAFVVNMSTNFFGITWNANSLNYTIFDYSINTGTTNIDSNTEMAIALARTTAVLNSSRPISFVYKVLPINNSDPTKRRITTHLLALKSSPSFNDTNRLTCTCPSSSSTNWVIDMTQNCVIVYNCTAANITFINSTATKYRLNFTASINITKIFWNVTNAKVNLVYPANAIMRMIT
jgi:hypothetical protein